MLNPSIELLRGLAFLSVFFFHLNLSSFWIGAYGVHFFFTLSGFLITDQIDRSARISSGSLLNYFARRGLRILPPYLAVLAVFHYLSPLPVAQALGIYDWWLLAQSLKGNAIASIGYWPLSGIHFWSLCVELQFYVVAGLLFYSIAYPLRFPVACVLTLFAILSRRITSQVYPMSFYGAVLPTMAEYFGAGAIVALALRRYPSCYRRFSAPIALLALIILAVAAFMLGRPQINVLEIQFQPGAWQTVRAVVFAYLIGSVWCSLWIPRWGSGLMHLFGRLSYPLYLVHPLAIAIAERGTTSLGRPHLMVMTVSLVLSLLGAISIWLLLERPVERYRNDIVPAV